MEHLKQLCEEYDDTLRLMQDPGNTIEPFSELVPELVERVSKGTCRFFAGTLQCCELSCATIACAIGQDMDMKSW